MKLSAIALLFPVVLFSCNEQEKIPDVSNIAVNLKTTRFERDLFDTLSNTLSDYLLQLQKKEPGFSDTYLSAILNVSPSWPSDSAAAYVNEFVKAYRPIFDSSEITFRNFTAYENEIKKGLQFVKYYFPSYPLPSKLITYIGPADGYGDILTDDAFVVGLQLHLGKGFYLYKTRLVQDTYPAYLSNRFEPSYIVVNCLNNVVNDLFPEKADDKTLVIQMIEKGKRLYLLSKFLPKIAEYQLIGYTEKQLEDAYVHEAVIWDLFVKNEYLRLNDKNIIKNYIGESPKTQELGEGAPGNIGSFTGWQIVKKFAKKNKLLSLNQLMNTDPETILQQAKYKP
jgi:hypothetical protein